MDNGNKGENNNGIKGRIKMKVEDEGGRIKMKEYIVN